MFFFHIFSLKARNGSVFGMYTLTPGRREEAGGSVRERGVLGPSLVAWLTWPSEAWAGGERFKARVEEGETAAVQPDQGPEKGCKATTGTSGEQGQEPGWEPSPGGESGEVEGQRRQQPETWLRVSGAPNLGDTAVK